MRLLKAIPIMLMPMMVHAESPPSQEMMLRCEKDSDCTVVEGACYSNWIVTNTTFESWLREQVEYSRQIKSCPSSYVTPPKPELRCVDGQCKATG